MNAVAISNNDMVYLHWPVPDKIKDCLGFTVIRHDAKTNAKEALPAMVGFPGSKRDAGKRFKTTDEWPVQKYAWKDLFAKRGGTFWYEIVPMVGDPAHLKADFTRAMRTKSVTLAADHGTCAVFFNRGIISTQAIARSLPKTQQGTPSSEALKKAIANPKSTIRSRLVGDLEHGVLTLIDRAAGEGGQCFCALYELADAGLIAHLKSLGKTVHIVLSNAGEDTEEGSGDGDSTNAKVRGDLHALKRDVTDRMLAKGHIGHNKFIVYKKGAKASAVLSGSTNWTANGLCAQSNNAIVIESPGLAADYLDYWNRLRDDTTAAGDDRTALQAKPFRTANHGKRAAHPLKDEQNKPAGDVRVWFSPNTPQKSVPSTAGGATPPAPSDLGEVFDLIDGAKQGALFLAFIPGKFSIVSHLKEVYDRRVAEGKLFYLRGAATSPDPATIFRVDLFHRTSRSDASVRAAPGARKAVGASASVSSVAGIFAAFAEWEAEIYKIGHAVIHDKILVIDPFTDDSVVVIGSHNLGFKASYGNDENLLIVRRNRAVAEAYAAHVLDVYEHYRWRWRLQAPVRARFAKLKAQNPGADSAKLWKQAIAEVGAATLKKAWQDLVADDTWQDFYQKNKNLLAAETNFWSDFGGEGLAPDHA